jgi:CheY-like chemotaxis protein
MTAQDKDRVLIVEDESDVLETYRLWLQGTYEVHGVQNGREAIETVDESYSVAIIDRVMDGVPGDEVLEHIREEELDIRIVMVTAIDPPEDDEIRGQSDTYRTKPIGSKELLKAVNPAVAK